MLEGEVKLLALQKTDRTYKSFPTTPEGVQSAIDFLAEDAAGGTIYKLEYYKDKHGDIIPRSTPLRGT